MTFQKQNRDLKFGRTHFNRNRGGIEEVPIPKLNREEMPFQNETCRGMRSRNAFFASTLPGRTRQSRIRIADLRHWLLPLAHFEHHGPCLVACIFSLLHDTPHAKERDPPPISHPTYRIPTQPSSPIFPKPWRLRFKPSCGVLCLALGSLFEP
jgi:hypothetical protein